MLETTGNEAGLISLWEERLRTKPSDKAAAKGLADKLVSNLRRKLKAPFELTTLGAVLDAVPPGTMAKWTASDISVLLEMTQEGFGPQRAVDFLVKRILKVKEHKRRTSLWDTALTMAKGLGEEAYLEIARIAMDAGRHDGARLAVATTLSRSDVHLEEAQDILRPLLDAKGEIGAQAQDLHRKITKSPALRGSQREALVAFEEAIGVGTPKIFQLRVAHTGQNYMLADVRDRPAPRFYDHKYLRVMVRADELPGDVPFAAIKKGDALKGPVRGQDADPKKDKNIRLYWIADPSKLTTDLTPEALKDRLQSLEGKFGVSTGETVRLKIGWDESRKSLVVRFYGKTGKSEFPSRPTASLENLPEGTKPQELGRGKRAWGTVEVDSKGNDRVYRVSGVVSFDAPKIHDEPSVASVTDSGKEVTDSGKGVIDSSKEVTDSGKEDSAAAPDAENEHGSNHPSEAARQDASEADVDSTETAPEGEKPSQVDAE